MYGCVIILYSYFNFTNIYLTINIKNIVLQWGKNQNNTILRLLSFSVQVRSFFFRLSYSYFGYHKKIMMEIHGIIWYNVLNGCSNAKGWKIGSIFCYVFASILGCYENHVMATVRRRYPLIWYSDGFDDRS